MFLVIVKQGTTPFQVDDFGQDVGRSAPGAIHFRPGQTKKLTPGEYQHILDKHPGHSGKLVVVQQPPRMQQVTEPVAPEPEPESEPEPAPEPEPEPVMDEAGEPSSGNLEAGSTGSEPSEKKKKRRQKKKKG